MRLLPFRPTDKIDIGENVDFVGGQERDFGVHSEGNVQEHDTIIFRGDCIDRHFE